MWQCVFFFGSFRRSHVSFNGHLIFINLPSTNLFPLRHRISVFYFSLQPTHYIDWFRQCEARGLHDSWSSHLWWQLAEFARNSHTSNPSPGPSLHCHPRFPNHLHTSSWMTGSCLLRRDGPDTIPGAVFGRAFKGFRSKTTPGWRRRETTRSSVSASSTNEFIQNVLEFLRENHSCHYDYVRYFHCNKIGRIPISLY